MIQNEQQYQITKEQLLLMEDAYSEAQKSLLAQTNVPTEVAQGQLNGIQFVVEDLRTELADYEKARIII